MKIFVGKLYQTIVDEGYSDRGMYSPGVWGVVKIIAVTGDLITYQDLDGAVYTTRSKNIKALPEHFKEVA